MQSEETDIIVDRPKLTAMVLRQRMLDHTYNLYTNFAFFIKGVVVALAAISLLAIVASPPENLKIVKFAFWIVSFLFGMVTLATWSRGSAFTNSRFNAADVAVPLILGTLEAGLYIVLAADVFVNTDVVSVVPYWYVIFGLFSFMATILVFNRWVFITEQDYEATPQMKKLVKESRGWLMKDIIGSFITGAIAFLMVLASQTWPATFGDQAVWSHIIFASIFGIIAIFIVVVSMTQYNRLERI